MAINYLCNKQVLVAWLVGDLLLLRDLDLMGQYL
jgi:hypothetical protein